jgi:hypothetical protein
LDTRVYNPPEAMLDIVFRGRRLEFASPLSVEELSARLAREVTAAVWRVTDTRTQTFEGAFADGRFRMVRLVHGRNSFRPLIEGQLVPLPAGTRIDVRLRLHPFVVIFCAILLAVGATLFRIVAADPEARAAVPPPLIALGAAAVCALVAGVAAAEARTATRLLAALFEAPGSRPGSPPAG